MNSLATVAALRDAGQFTAALKALGEIRISAQERTSAEVLRAELLERTGAYPESRSLTETVLRKTNLLPGDRSTCELVLARLELELGRVNHGISHLQHSITLATEQHDLARMCWPQLRLLLVLSDRSGPDSVRPMLTELRTHVMQSGDPIIMAALHIHLAETEAKRGLLRNASRHLIIAKKGLAGFPNRWLEALAENVESAIETMHSDFGAAFTHARRCLELAQDVGAANVQESALGNLGNLSFLASNFEEAGNWLDRAASARKGSDNWTACVDTLARIHLAQDRLADCKQLLDEIDETVPPSDDLSRYVYRHTQMTRMLLLARMNHVDDALRHASFVVTLATRSGDQLLNDLVLLAKAEILQAAGRTVECVSLLQTMVSAIPRHSPDFLAQYERTLACTMVRTGQLERAEQHRKRAARIYAGLKHEAGQLELSRCWNHAVAEDAMTQKNSAKIQPINLAAVVIADIASVMQHAGRTELIARELVDLLAAAECIDHAMAIARASDGSVETLAQAGKGRDQESVDEQRLVVGTARERAIEILVTPKPDLESIATIHSISLLLATLHDLERAHAEREDHATLWPVDELPSGEDGAVTVGHMREVMALARRIANVNVSVLITGESGTGKEVVARAIHAHSNRAQKPFIPFNCTTIPRDLLESQLFGHRRGAFTGADRDNPGVIRSARDGTLFLDEIGDMSLELQPKLLRFLESGEICPLGESTPFVVNVRVVAATNSNLEGLVRDGKFREDLFYRLNVIRLSIRPLRERRDEILTLINHFLLRAAEEFRKSHIRIAEETMERLVLYAWPGNVRQLQNEIRRIVALAEPGTILRPDVLSGDIVKTTAGVAFSSSPKAEETGAPPGEKLNPALSRIEREMIKAALSKHHGKVEAVAKALGISRKGLYLKRQRLGL